MTGPTDVNIAEIGGGYVAYKGPINVRIKD